MNASDILVPPSLEDHRSEKQRALWAATHERIERFLPGFLDEVIPSPLPASKHAEVPPESASAISNGAAS